MSDKTRVLVENGLIGIGLLSFWPRIMGYDELWYQAILLAVLVMLGWLAVVRYRRVKRALETEDQRLRRGQGPQGPTAK